MWRALVGAVAGDWYHAPCVAPSDALRIAGRAIAGPPGSARTLAIRITVSESKLLHAGRPRTIDDLLELCGGRRRARILFALLDGPLDVSALALLLGLLGSSISHSLRPLRDTGLVGRRRIKKRCVYTLGAAITVVRTGNRVGLELSATDESSVVLWELEPAREARSGDRRGASARAPRGSAR